MGNSTSTAGDPAACAARTAGIAGPASHVRSFYSQAHQDWAVAGVLHTAGKLNLHTRTQSRSLVYVDLAANDAQHDSNTFFFDRCLGAKGLCIEPNPQYHQGIQSKRRCALEKVCVSDAEETVDFVLMGGLGHISPRRRLLRMQCSRLQRLLTKHQLRHVNYLSLDIEGAELKALRSLDWTSTSFDVMTVENAKEELRDFLASKGMVPTLCVSLDTMFVRAGHMQHAAARWYDRLGQHLLPGCLSNRTTDCIGNAASFLRCQASEKSH